MIKYFFTVFILICFYLSAEDRFVNPLKDICWGCLFPLKIAGMDSEDVKDNGFDFSKTVCFCYGQPPRPGIPLSFWEPTKLIDVTKEAYKLVGLGGVKIGNATLKNRGFVGGHLAKTSFSHVHIYDYPILTLLGILTDFACIEKGSLDLQYFSELDIAWYDTSLANILNPEVTLFANPLAQAACAADCITSSTKYPINQLFWCAGCHGSLYPLMGFVGSHVGPIQEALLLSQRALAKMHRTGLMKGFKDGDYCGRSYMPIWKKSNYKAQIALPIAKTQGECPYLGGTEVLWGAGKWYPGAEDFTFILWTKKQCCLDAAKFAIEGLK